MPYTIFCSTADDSRMNRFWVESRDRQPTRAEAAAIRLLLSDFYWSNTAAFEMPPDMTVETLESAMQSVTGVTYKLAYNNKTLCII
jgi:hypothetical protein